MQNPLYYKIIEFEGLVVNPLHIVLGVSLYFIGLIAIKYTRRFFKSKEIVNKSITTLEGKEVPLWRLTRQFIWFLVVILFLKMLRIGNPELDFQKILAFEFFRFDKFHIAVYHIFVVSVVLIGGRVLMNFLRIYLQRRFKKREGIDQGTEFVYLQLTKYLLITVGIIVIMRSLGIDLNLFLTATAFLLVGLGLGLQDIFKDFFAGLLLLFEGSVKVGDVIEIDRFEGKDNFVATVTQINIRTSKVRTREDKTLIVPNSHLTFQKVHNWDDKNEFTRFSIPISVMYGQELEIVKKSLIEAAMAHPMVSKNHEVIVRLLNFGDNGLELDLVFWAKRSLNIEIHKSDIRFEIDRKFREHNIEYPYPQMDVHYDQKGQNQESKGTIL
ncbi:MAG: mechanosensitive ion channel domain-containing protein [Crocinitomicaceae bacterium]